MPSGAVKGRHDGPSAASSEPGGTFTVPAGERLWLFVLAGLAELVERPSWWPSTTPTSPPRAVGARTVEPIGAAEARRLLAERRPVLDEEEGDEDAAS